MSMKITAWLVDAETKHERLILGEKWPGGAYAQSLVLMIDAQNAVYAEQRACEVRCTAALSDKDAEIEQLRSALTRMDSMHAMVMAQANHGASCYDADCLHEMNAAPIQAARALGPNGANNRPA